MESKEDEALLEEEVDLQEELEQPKEECKA